MEDKKLFLSFLNYKISFTIISHSLYEFGAGEIYISAICVCHQIKRKIQTFYNFVPVANVCIF